MEKLSKFDDYDKLFLCRPCAEKMKSMRTCKDVILGAHQKKKGECEQCGCRRYGYDCKVLFNYELNNERTTKGVRKVYGTEVI